MNKKQKEQAYKYFIGEEEVNKIVCPFCNEPFTAKMETQFDYSMGSEWTGVYGENITVEIRCSKCKKLIYKKNQDAYL